MKKSELTQLTEIIECLVAKELKKQLPKVIGEVFRDMMGRPIISEKQSIPYEESDESNLDKLSMRELFSEEVKTSKKSQIEQPEQVKETKRYAKDPKINAILNETVSDLIQRERLVGAAAYQGGYSPSPSMAVGPEFMPTMAPRQAVSLIEGQESNHVPMADIPQGISALDVARQVPIAAPVAQALTKNYSAMMKLIDKKKGKI